MTMTAAARITDWASVHPAPMIAAVSALAVAASAVIVRCRTLGRTGRRAFSAGTLAAAVAFVICTSVSLNTSFRFTVDGLGMTGTPERLLSCAAFEALIAMCVLGARERMDGDAKSPGWYGSAVWAFAALSSVPAWHEGGGFSTGTVVRIIVGSFGSALAAHSALGLELRHRTGDESQSPMAQVARDLRERLMARLGLAHRNRTAQQIARDRALSRAVDLADRHSRLSDKDKTGARGAKLAKELARALDRAGCAEDEAQLGLFRARVALRRYATDLEITPAESPWHRGGRHAEAPADQEEDGAADRTGTLLPGVGQPRAAARMPQQHGHRAEEEAEAQPSSPPRDLRSYPTKRAALEALFAVRITGADPRTTNAIAEELLAELAAAGIPLDRGAANRYVAELRTTRTPLASSSPA
ncbi:hypothetical protein [Actinacidiphila sp. ITFR-21]|uniref:hypothetical protein n=1 Tax=Actinacidiphila sp. ITFR-21 TaxID=3075199 RepID=UPI00288B7D1F|nr:hypothetical protein [Streptomyces sp. ITFR-21]WNI19944.1 hypothetical protein RLT57_30855 [Streptomyces sp. ITFR-21]